MNVLTAEATENLEQFRHGFSIELEQALDMIHHGQKLPLDQSMRDSIKKIENIFAEAKKDGAEITLDAVMLTCADEAKRTFQKQLSNYTKTLFDIFKEAA